MKIITIFFCLVFLNACSEKIDIKESNDKIIKFKERKIDLTPYFNAFPYHNFLVSYEANRIFYYKQDETTLLHSVNIKNLNFNDGKPILDLDLSLRNVWSMKFNKKDKHLYWMGDEKNDEKIDLFRLNPETSDLQKLTDVPYIFGWSFNRNHDKIAYIVRLGNLENRKGQLRILNLDNLSDELVVEDDEEFRFTWGTPSWSNDDKLIAIPVLKDAKRTHANVSLIDISNKNKKIITNYDKARYFPQIYNKWISNNSKFLYTSDESGYTNIYTYDNKISETNQLTNYNEDLSDFAILEYDSKDILITITSNPVRSTIKALDLQTNKVITELVLDFKSSIQDYDKNRLILQLESANTKFKLIELTLEKDFKINNLYELPKDINNSIVQAEVEKIDFETFDIDTNTNKKRKIHAFLYKPKNPLPSDESIVMIQSFYGGSNNYNIREHILAEAGIYVLSPSPRGSSGFGKEFYALNDKDLGGNEILDIIFAAKYISEKLSIPPDRIGVFGGSHGGYATMRLLTFPGEVNNNKYDFDFGFGIAHAGFSDIIHFYENCNIPDWVILEAGDPKSEKDKLMSRSPLFNAYDMSGRLLLTHGVNDSRVPIEGSRFMYDSLKKYEKNVVLEEYQDMGHHIKGLENNIRQYKTWFNFIENEK